MKNDTNIWIPIGAAALAFIGALLGTFLSAYMKEDLWEKKVNYEERRLILTQRIKLIERVSIIVNKAPIAASLQDFIELQADIMKLNVDCIKTDGNGGLDNKQCFPQEKLVNNLKVFNDRASLNAEFASTLQLTSLYFGVKTRNAAKDYATISAWWGADKKYSLNLLAAMQDELTKFE